MTVRELLAVPVCLVFACGEDTSAKDVQESTFVDLVIALSVPADDVVTVTLRDHADVLLDTSTSLGAHWAEWMDSQRESQRPIYLEIELGTRVVLDYDVPIESEVHSLVDGEQGVQVQLMRSAAIHFLNRSHAKYEQFLATLETAKQSGGLVLVTTDYDHGNEIRDVREPLSP